MLWDGGFEKVLLFQKIQASQWDEPPCRSVISCSALKIQPHGHTHPFPEVVESGAVSLAANDSGLHGSSVETRKS